MTKKRGKTFVSPASLFLRLLRQIIFHDIAEMLCRNSVFLQQNCQSCGFFKSWRNIVNAVKLCLSANSRNSILRPFICLAFCNNVVNHLLLTPLSSSGINRRFLFPCHPPAGLPTPYVHYSSHSAPFSKKSCGIHFTRIGKYCLSNLVDQKAKKIPQMG